MVSFAGTLDADCPIWDHVVQLFVCCEDPDGGTSHCDKCDVTPWMTLAANGRFLFVPLLRKLHLE